MKDERVVLDQNDVTVKPINEMCECEESHVSHAVLLDMRGNGVQQEVFRGCWHCCAEFGTRLKDSLPIPQPEPFAI